jgi:AmmeMemoRadiSam system protein A
MTRDERRTLLAIAREAIAAHLTGVRLDLPEPAGTLAQPAGAFVSLHLSGDLRGCIGHVEPDDPVARIVARCAVAAATSDPRFAPLTRAELDEAHIELSVLGPLEPIAGPADIVVGAHGLVVERGWSRGLLLPQVATEWGWDAETFLAHTCRKAGLAHDVWRSGATLWRFTAEVFSERSGTI